MQFCALQIVAAFCSRGLYCSLSPFLSIFLTIFLPIFLSVCVCAFHFAKSYLSLQNKRQIEITLQLKSLVIEKYNRMPQVQSSNSSSRKHRVIFSETYSSTFIVYIFLLQLRLLLLLLYYCCIVTAATVY